MTYTLKTGLEPFDQHTDGLSKNGLNVISGASGTGKTKLLVGMVNGISKGHKCLYLTSDPPPRLPKKTVVINHNICNGYTLIEMVKVMIKEEGVDVVCVDDISLLMGSAEYDVRKHFMENLRRLDATAIVTASSYRHPELPDIVDTHWAVADLGVRVTKIIPFNCEKEQYIVNVGVIKSRHGPTSSFNISLDLLDNT